jgi:hypothetical protein
MRSQKRRRQRLAGSDGGPETPTAPVLSPVTLTDDPQGAGYIMVVVPINFTHGPGITSGIVELWLLVEGEWAVSTFAGIDTTSQALHFFRADNSTYSVKARYATAIGVEAGAGPFSNEVEFTLPGH